MLVYFLNDCTFLFVGFYSLDKTSVEEGEFIEGKDIDVLWQWYYGDSM